jgi:hypothetical protein
MALVSRTGGAAGLALAIVAGATFAGRLAGDDTPAPTTTVAPATVAATTVTTTAAPPPTTAARSTLLVDVRTSGRGGAECATPGVLARGRVVMARRAAQCSLDGVIDAREADGRTTPLRALDPGGTSPVVELVTEPGRTPTGRPLPAAGARSEAVAWFARNGELRTAPARTSEPLVTAADGTPGVGGAPADAPDGAIVVVDGEVRGVLGEACPPAAGAAGARPPCPAGVSFRRLDPLGATVPDAAPAALTGVAVRTTDGPTCVTVTFADTGGRWTAHWLVGGVQVARLDAIAPATSVDVCRTGTPAAAGVAVVVVAGERVRRAETAGSG